MICFSVLDVLFCGPEISPVAWTPFVLGIDTILQFLKKYECKFYNFWSSNPESESTESLN
jgi:hypothetical protein